MAKKVAQLHIGNVNAHILSDQSGHHVHLLRQTWKLGIAVAACEVDSAAKTQRFAPSGDAIWWQWRVDQVYSAL
jgi:hypothetical protein